MLLCKVASLISSTSARRYLTIIDEPLGKFDSRGLCDPGELYTWGKGRYGRLGHGDSEDQLRPKLVESLLGYRVIDVACGELTTTALCDIGLIDGALVA